MSIIQCTRLNTYTHTRTHTHTHTHININMFTYAKKRYGASPGSFESKLSSVT